MRAGFDQIVESIGAGDVGPIFVSIYAIFNCFGRMGMGYLSEVALHRWGTPRRVSPRSHPLSSCCGCLWSSSCIKYGV